MLIKLFLIIFVYFQFYLKAEDLKYENDINYYSSKSEVKQKIKSEIYYEKPYWEIENSDFFKDRIFWDISDDEDFDVNSLISNPLVEEYHSRFLNIRALDKSITVDEEYYPEISHYVPNAYVEDSQKLITTSLRTISKLRFCDSPNFDTKCADGFLNIDLNLINTNDFSFNTRFSLQSISNRGTNFGEESSLGFKAAKRLSPKWSIAFGGENIIHLDKNIDMGRNFYLVASTYHKLFSNHKKNSRILFLNAGIGSDFFGYRGNGFLGRTSCFGKPTLTGNGTQNCNWGPIGSLAFAFNDRVAFINEWFGYGYGTGISLKPIKNKPLILSIYATDYIKGFPNYIEEHCPNNDCQPRFYGNISLSY